MSLPAAVIPETGSLTSAVIGNNRYAIVASSDLAFRNRVVERLRAADWRADSADGGADALAKLEENPYRLVLLDSHLPDLDSSELADTLERDYPAIDIVLMDTDSERFFQRGRGPAAETLTVVDLLERSGEPSPSTVMSPSQANPPSEGTPRTRPQQHLNGMIGASATAATISRMVRLVAPRTTPVLVMGETGTGKELVAHALHDLSPRAKNPFVVINCAAIPEALLEAELFGFERGAFTGAVQSRAGRIRIARGGTLFLDEIGEIPLNMQSKLLRFLQEGEVQRLGSPEVTHVETRIVAATNLDLGKQVKEGKFRADLFYRLTVFPIHIPPLRERVEDVLPLAEHFTELLCRQAGAPTKQISPASMRYLEQYPWPGNVRELQHVIERAFILSEDSQELLLGPQHGTQLSAAEDTRRPAHSELHSFQFAV